VSSIDIQIGKSSNAVKLCLTMLGGPTLEVDLSPREAVAISFEFFRLAVDLDPALHEQGGAERAVDEVRRESAKRPPPAPLPPPRTNYRPAEQVRRMRVLRRPRRGR
jgi:hypothetical protein